MSTRVCRIVTFCNHRDFGEIVFLKYKKTAYYVIFSIGLVLFIIGCKEKNKVVTESFDSSITKNTKNPNTTDEKEISQFLDRKRLAFLRWLKQLYPNRTTLAEEVFLMSDSEINAQIEQLNALVAYNYTLLDTQDIVHLEELSDPCDKLRKLILSSLNVHIEKNPKDFLDIYKSSALLLMSFYIAELKKQGVSITEGEEKQELNKIQAFQNASDNCSLVYDGLLFKLKKIQKESALDLKLKVEVLREALRFAMAFMDLFSYYNDTPFVSLLVTKGKSEPKEQSDKASIVESTHFTIDNSSMGYIKITLFKEGITDNVNKAIQALSRPQGIMLDLRDNGGGSVYEMLDLVHLFLNDAHMFRIIKESSNLTDTHDNSYFIGPVEIPHRSQTKGLVSRTPSYGGPIAILINEGTASAAELFTELMKDYGRALILGKQSFGKGIGQVVREIKENGSEKSKETLFGGEIGVTNSIFFNVNTTTELRRSFPQGEGIHPHIIIDDGNREKVQRMKDFDPSVTIDPSPFYKLAKEYKYADSVFVPFNENTGSIISQLKSPDTRAIKTKEEQLEIAKKILYDFIQKLKNQNSSPQDKPST